MLRAVIPKVGKIASLYITINKEDYGCFLCITDFAVDIVCV